MPGAIKIRTIRGWVVRGSDIVTLSIVERDFKNICKMNTCEMEVYYTIENKRDIMTDIWSENNCQNVRTFQMIKTALFRATCSLRLRLRLLFLNRSATFKHSHDLILAFTINSASILNGSLSQVSSYTGGCLAYFSARLLSVDIYVQ